jgi:protein disulfide-isomerase
MAAWRAVAVELQNHPGFTVSEQLYAFMPEFDLLALEAEPDDPSVPVSLQQKVASRVQDALAVADEPGELQTVLNMAVWLTIMAGQPEAAEALLDEHLDAAVAPHYFLSLLGDLSADRPDVALEWHRMAWERSGGGSSAVKWGAAYVEKLIELTPDDAPAVEAAARQLLEQVMASEDAFAGRNSTYLQALERALVSWAADEPRATVVTSLRADVQAQCDRFDNTPDAPQRERCRSFLEGVAGP